MKKIHFLFLVLISTSGQYLCAQSIQFNKLYQSKNYGFFGFAEFQDSYILSNGGDRFFEMNKNGNITDSLDFSDSEAFGRITPDMNGNFISVDTYMKLDSNNYLFAFLISKYSPLFDTIWSKQYFLSPQTKVLYDCTVDSDNNIYATGFSLESASGAATPNRNFVIMKINTDGDFLWQQNYGDTLLPNPEGWTIEYAGDSTLIAGGFTDWIGGSVNQLFLQKTDLNGVSEWNITLGNPAYSCGGINDIAVTMDSSYLITGNYTFEISGQLKKSAYLAKVDHGGALVWDKISYVGNMKELDYVLETEDGNITSYGNGGTDTDHVICRFDRNGNFLWYKNIRLDSAYSIYNLIPYDFQATADSGFAVVGQAMSFSSIYPTPYMIKTDSLACDGLYSCMDNETEISLLAYHYEDSICAGDSALIGISILNGTGPFTAITFSDFIYDNDTIEESLYLMTDSTSHLFYYTPDLTDPVLHVTVYDKHGFADTAQIIFNVVDCHLGDTELKHDPEFSLFPNPAGGELNIILGSMESDMSRAIIYNCFGNSVMDIIPLERNITLNISQLKPGIYYVRIIAQKESIVRSFIKL
jgi:hypothetical protein